MEFGAAIASLLGIILWGLKQWQAERANRETNSADINIQKMRKVLSKSDTAGVSAVVADQHDRVQQALCCDPSRGNGSGEQNPVGSTLPGQRESAQSPAAVPR